MRIRPVTSTVSGGMGDMGSRSLSMRMVASRESRATREEAVILLWVCLDVIYGGGLGEMIECVGFERDVGRWSWCMVGEGRGGECG